MTHPRGENRAATSLLFVCLVAFAAAETVYDEDTFYGIAMIGLIDDTPAPTTAAPTPAPTFAPAPPGCEDDPDFIFRKALPNSDCTWVAQKPQRRCSLNRVADACLATCGTCPTSTPDPSCVDDPDFLWQKRPGKDCEWVEKNKAVRCKRAKISAACQQTCNSCTRCADDPDFFLNARNPTKTCEWAAKKPWRRCNSSRISAACQKTCNSSCKRCADDPDFFLNARNPTKTCEWAAKKPSRRCNSSRISAACQKTCNSCEPCADDPDFFLNARYPNKTCEWAAKKPSRRCNSSRISAACPVTCSTC